LAFQIGEQFRVLGNSINLKQCIIVGGLDMTTQALELSKKPHIVIATPGRLVDHIKNSCDAIHFKRIKFLVLDEADRLLNQSFENDLKAITKVLPTKKQTLLFSATMTKEIEAIEFDQQKPFIYSLSEGYETVDNCTQEYLFIPSTVRLVYLVYLLLNQLKGKSIFLFCSKPKTCEVLRLTLKGLDIRSTALHSQMSQNERLSSLAKFKSNIVPILISTDVGSRYSIINIVV
jgi:ATP-dependent RNA helicase DDX49/DBP8